MVAIPARNEADLLPGCLAALAVQRDRLAAPLPEKSFSVVVLANNCTDSTVETAMRMRPRLPYPLHVLGDEACGGVASAGAARRAAMEEGALMLAASAGQGAILTTDADTLVAATWISANLEALADGADAVAGYVLPDPADYVALGPAFMARGRLEDTYIRLRNEIWACLDPVAHDPWPNHRVASGASLAVSLQTYLDVGGLPRQPVGEDAEFVRVLERAGHKVRHSLDVQVTTSCRLEGRSGAGAAATMKARFDNVEAACDDDLEPVFATARRALYKGRLRLLHERQGMAHFSEFPWPNSAAPSQILSFGDLWDEVENTDPRLRRGPVLTPRDLPRQIELALRLLVRLRARGLRAGDNRADSRDVGPESEPELSAA